MSVKLLDTMKLIPNYCHHPDYYNNPGVHLLYVGDFRRVDAFVRAIHRVVQPGMIVADIGTGSGILAREAVKAGAERVYGIESAPEIVKYARRINETLGLDSCIELIEGDSRDVTLPERADVLVSELIGGLGNDESISHILEDARLRHAKPNAEIIPKAIDVFICPVDAPEAHEQIRDVYQNDVLVRREDAIPPFGAYYELLGLPPERLLSEQAALDKIDLTGQTERTYQRRSVSVIKREGLLSGFAVWFVASLSEGVEMDTSPWAPLTCWGQAFLPIRTQVPVDPGDVVDYVVGAEIADERSLPTYHWEGSVFRHGEVVASFGKSSIPVPAVL